MHNHSNNTLTSKPTEGIGKTAWVFAGQGSQFCGMGKDIYQSFPQTREIFESPAAGFDLRRLCFEAGSDELANTRYTQAALAAFAGAVIKVLREHQLSSDAALGLSLGEYSALHAAGVFSLETTLELLAYRGKIMAEAADANPGSMIAVIGLSDHEVEQCVEQASVETGLVVSCCNYNCPGQVVVGGEAMAVIAAKELLIKAGARRCLPLQTSGPFHTSLMNEAAIKLSLKLAGIKLLPQQIPVYFNATATTAADEQIPVLLARQIASPVLFAQSIRNLWESGVRVVVEVGPGNVLAGLIKKTTPDIKVVSIQTAKDLMEVIADA